VNYRAAALVIFVILFILSIPSCCFPTGPVAMPTGAMKLGAWK
jgi:hypothetical protein